MTLLSTVCRFLIPAKQDGYLPGSAFSNVANFMELKRFADRREGLTASLFYNPDSPHPLYSKNCGLPFLTDRSGSNAQSFIFYNYNLTNRLSNIVTAPQLHATEEPSLRQFRSQTTYPFLSGIWQFQSLFPFYRLNGLSFLHAFRLSFPRLPV